MRKETIKTCVDISWASFLCILALSSVCNRTICLLYQDSKEKLFRNLFNSIIHPMGESVTSQPNISILFCRSGITKLHKRNNNKFQANHFVPIVPVSIEKNPSLQAERMVNSFTKQNLFFICFQTNYIP